MTNCRGLDDGTEDGTILLVLLEEQLKLEVHELLEAQLRDSFCRLTMSDQDCMSEWCKSYAIMTNNLKSAKEGIVYFGG
jgi:hypothetical protein